MLSKGDSDPFHGDMSWQRSQVWRHRNKVEYWQSGCTRVLWIAKFVQKKRLFGNYFLATISIGGPLSTHQLISGPPPCMFRNILPSAFCNKILWEKAFRPQHHTPRLPWKTTVSINKGEFVRVIKVISLLRQFPSCDVHQSMVWRLSCGSKVRSMSWPIPMIHGFGQVT